MAVVNLVNYYENEKCWKKKILHHAQWIVVLTPQNKHWEGIDQIGISRGRMYIQDESNLLADFLGQVYAIPGNIVL